ncbi:hypothetical protein BBP10_10980 [Limosilactobacillus reuteri]|nr:hypothetical protein BBP10_10980 [Limosilactobacillus reuteri]
MTLIKKNSCLKIWSKPIIAKLKIKRAFKSTQRKQKKEKKKKKREKKICPPFFLRLRKYKGKEGFFG